MDTEQDNIHCMMYACNSRLIEGNKDNTLSNVTLKQECAFEM